jgi:hypothetical protein
MIAINPHVTTTMVGAVRRNNQGLIQGNIDHTLFIQGMLENGTLYVDPNVAIDLQPLVVAGSPLVTFTRNDIVGIKTQLARKAITGDTAEVITGFSTSFGAGNSEYLGAPLAAGNSEHAPAFIPGGNITFLRFGSKARINVRINNALAASLAAGNIPENTPLKWDFVNEELATWTTGTDAANLKLPVKLTAVAIAGHETTIAFKLSASGLSAIRDTALSIATVEL